jgi:hypothetical protein
MDSKVGIPSDLAPLDRSPMLTGAGLPAVSSTECCAHNQWEPIAERLQADGVTLEIHGQRDSDWGPMVPRDSPLRGSIEEWRPIRAWTDDDVFAYLKSRVLSWRASPAMARHQAPIVRLARQAGSLAALPTCGSITPNWPRDIARTYAATRQALNRIYPTCGTSCRNWASRSHVEQRPRSLRGVSKWI